MIRYGSAYLLNSDPLPVPLNDQWVETEVVIVDGIRQYKFKVGTGKQRYSRLPYSGTSSTVPSSPEPSTLVVTAGEAIGGHRVVMMKGSVAVYYDVSENNTGKALGMSSGAASAGGPTSIVTSGKVNNPGWGLVAGEVYFAAPSGMISLTPRTLGISQRVGVALDSNNLQVQLSEPYILI